LNNGGFVVVYEPTNITGGPHPVVINGLSLLIPLKKPGILKLRG
jgi:hypothetical protein